MKRLRLSKKDWEAIKYALDLFVDSGANDKELTRLEKQAAKTLSKIKEAHK